MPKRRSDAAASSTAVTDGATPVSHGSVDIDAKGLNNSEIMRLLSDMKESLCCPICDETFRSATLLVPCGHTFCRECLDKMKKVAPGSGCPLCRRRFAQEIPNITVNQQVRLACEYVVHSPILFLYIDECHTSQHRCHGAVFD
jgi:hypothetical protein